MAAALAIGLVLAISSRPPPRICDEQNPFRGLDELITVGALVLGVIVVGVSGLIVTAVARSRVGPMMMAIAAGLLLAVVANALLPRPAETGCLPDTRSEPATVRLVISSPFQLDQDGPGVCFNMRDPDPEYGTWVGSDTIDGYEVGVQLGFEGSEETWVEIISMAGDMPTFYSGPADWVTSDSVRFADLAGDEPDNPTLSGTISWTCLGGTDSGP
jgi:hypothetical protein